MTEIEKMFKAFAIGNRVRVVGTDIIANVLAIIYNAEGCQYQIAYWHDNIRRTEWVLLAEIEKEEA